MTIPFINLKKQYEQNRKDIDTAIHRVLDHGQYIMGPEVKKLESQLADYIGAKHCLACSSGTDALVLPLMTYGCTLQDAIFISPFTFFASAESISLAGATPVFVDIDPLTYNISSDSLEAAIKQVIDEGRLNPRGIIPVDLFGLAADYQEINKIAEKYGLFVLEDAAQSFAAEYHNKRAGNLADVASTSFYPAKPLGCYGDGGAVFTNDSALYEELISLRVHGQGTSGDKYDNVRIGLNARMDTIQAAILLEKLKLYDEELILREQAAQTYNKRLSDKVTIPFVPKSQSSVWAQYSIQVGDRDKLKVDLANQGIPTSVFYPTPIHLSTAYKYLNYKIGDFPVSESVAKHIISLPMHPYMDEKTINQICEAVNLSIE